MKKITKIIFLSIASIFILLGVVYFFVLPKEIKSNIKKTNEIEKIFKLNEDEIGIKEFKTDKEIYGSHEEIQFLVNFLLKKDIENVEIKITGINPYQYDYINESKTVNLIKGENIIYFNAETPYCTSGCGGVFPGPYDIYVNIFINGDLIKSEKTIINLIDH